MGQNTSFGLRLLAEDSDETSSIKAPIVMRAASGTDIRLGVCCGILVGVLIALAIMRRRDRVRIALYRCGRRNEHIVERTGAIAVHVDGSSPTSLWASVSILDLIGHSMDAMCTIDMSALVHPKDLDLVLSTYRSVDPILSRALIAFRVLHRNGSTVWVEGGFDRLEAGSETIMTLRDISETRRVEEALGEASQAVRDAQAAAAAAGRAKTDFLAGMSHEIRTPLNAILGFADVLLGTTDLSTSARRNVERIKAGGDALLTIVGDILDVSLAQTGQLRLDPRPLALPLLVDECIALVQQSAVAKHLALRVELVDRFPTGLMGDEGRIRQILLNLMNNAIKFTQHGVVTMRIGYDHAAGADRILFQVTDTGIGIDAADMPALFQPFRQVDGSLRRSYGGTGLGLAISKLLVDLMGGTIGADSQRGSGSRFWFSIPLAAVPLLLAGEPERRRDARSVGLSILLVEDVAINQELARAILETQGHRVDVVSDGADAIMAVQDSSYDLVLMDVQMPFVDGFTATREIRALTTPASRVPIVAMTANVLREHVDAAYAAGMNDFVAKPISIEALLEVVERTWRNPQPGLEALRSVA